MARITVTIPDDLSEFYEEEVAKRTQTGEVGLTLERVLADRLQRSVPLHPRLRTLILEQSDLSALESRLGHGQLKSPMELVERVARLGRIKFGDYEITLTPAQMEDIAFRAMKQNRTIDEMIRITWQKMDELFFSYVP